MSEKQRQKKDGRRKDKDRQAMKAAPEELEVRQACRFTISRLAS